MTEFTPHRRQFVIDRGDTPPVPGWQTRVLTSGHRLHHCPALPVADDGDELVLGIALGSGDPARRGGRHVRVVGHHLHTDAGGLLGVYVGDGGDGIVAGSSLALVARLTGAARTRRRLGWYSFNWHPLPTSGRVGVDKLLPATALDLHSGTRRHRAVPAPAEGTVDERAAALERALRSQLEAQRGSTWVALTAGLDSRTVLAAALAAGCDVRTFTQRYPGLADGEWDLIVDLARRAGVEHVTVPLQRRPSTASRRLDEHTDRETVDADRYAVARGGLDFVAPGDRLLRGGIFEYGRRFFDDALGHLTWAEVLEAPHRVSERARMGPIARRSFDDAMIRWVSLRRDLPASAHWIDVFYLDQRIGGWLAAIEQLLDGAVDASLHPANHPDVLGAVVAAADRPALGDAVQRRAIERMAPDLLELPVNPTGLVSRLRAVAQRARLLARMATSELRSLGGL